MSELLDCVIQQINRIGDIDIRPAGIFVFFHKHRENIELVTLLGAGGSSPKPFNLGDGRSMIVIVSDGVNFHGAFP
jgi:hypothetical protein